MTRPAAHREPLAPAAAAPGPHWLGEDTAVLLDRQLVERHDAPLSRFGEDVWRLDHAVHEAHAPATSLHFAAIPAPLRPAAKYYTWHMINTDRPVPLDRSKVSRYAIRTVRASWPFLVAFLTWLHRREVTELRQVSADLLEDYLADLGADDTLDRQQKYEHVTTVRRIWAYRDVLPEAMRLPAAIPWGGDDGDELFGAIPRGGRENRTRRIVEKTMQPLLAWSLHVVEDLADDIVAAHADYLSLKGAARGQRWAADTSEGSSYRRVDANLAAYLERLRRDGGSLPGIRAADGTTRPDWGHLARILHYSGGAGLPRLRPNLAAAVLGSGIPIADAAYLDAPITGQLAGRPWRDRPIAYNEAPRLARHLATAAAVVVAYLSGARPAEVLNLRRGCIEHVGGLWLMTGVYFKNARDADGNKLPAGAPRRQPWVVVESVVRAVAVLERLHDQDLLFPVHFDGAVRADSRRAGAARTAEILGRDLHAFIAWANDLGHAHGIAPIPADPHGPVNLTRLRRTLAWFIRARPRGVVAGALQYGHVGTSMFQGYAGTYDSGFPDEFAFEDFLTRLDELADNQHALADGEHVSGPAADTYRQRVSAAHKQFAGHVLTTGRQARDLVANPFLQLFHGTGMTCVFDAKQAACQLRGPADDPQTTPDLDDCRPRCPNIARTDRDIVEIQRRRDDLAAIVADPLAPPIRHRREQHELDRLDAILENHR